MIIKYSYSETGCTCDRCGTFIKHIYSVTDGIKSYKVGSNCIDKITNVSGEGKKLVDRISKELEAMENKLNEFLTRDYDMIRIKFFPHSTSPLEEFKIAVEDHIKFYTLKLAQEQKKFENKMRKVSLK